MTAMTAAKTAITAKTGLRNMLIKAGAGAALALGLAGAAQAGDGIEPGRYAIKQGGNFYNYHTFSCAGQSAFYCGYLDEKLLTPEEQSLLDDADSVIGDITIQKSEKGDNYAAAGNFYLSRVCTLSTADRSEDVGRYITVPCKMNPDSGELACLFHADYDIPGITFYMKQNPDKSLSLRLEMVSEPEDLPQNYRDCMTEMSSRKLAWEPQKDYEDNMFMSARMRYFRNDGELNAKWNDLSREKRKELLPAQRKWIKSKDKFCGPIDPKKDRVKLMSAYECHAAMTEKRTYELEQ